MDVLYECPQRRQKWKVVPTFLCWGTPKNREFNIASWAWYPKSTKGANSLRPGCICSNTTDHKEWHVARVLPFCLCWYCKCMWANSDQVGNSNMRSLGGLHIMKVATCLLSSVSLAFKSLHRFSEVLWQIFESSNLRAAQADIACSKLGRSLKVQRSKLFGLKWVVFIPFRASVKSMLSVCCITLTVCIACWPLESVCIRFLIKNWGTSSTVTYFGLSSLTSLTHCNKFTYWRFNEL